MAVEPELVGETGEVRVARGTAAEEAIAEAVFRTDVEVVKTAFAVFAAIFIEETRANEILVVARETDAEVAVSEVTRAAFDAVGRVSEGVDDEKERVAEEIAVAAVELDTVFKAALLELKEENSAVESLVVTDAENAVSDVARAAVDAVGRGVGDEIERVVGEHIVAKDVLEVVGKFDETAVEANVLRAAVEAVVRSVAEMCLIKREE